MFGVQFYPTPPGLAQRMLMPVDFTRVRYALEPSAGKGDLAAVLQKKVKVDCVEIDPDLRSVLTGREFAVVGDDFLRFDPHTRYDLVCMNPPFADGDKHLLHALELMRHGGQVTCLLNANTLRNPCSNTRLALTQKLRELGAVVEIVEDAFSDAERAALVDVAMIYVDIQSIDEVNVLENLMHGKDLHHQSAEYADEQLAENDIFKALICQYDLECKAGLGLLDTYRQLQKYIPKAEIGRGHLLTVEGEIEKGFSLENSYVRQLRRKYWAAVFGLKQMQGLFTNDLRESYLGQLERFKSYDFSMGNLAQLQLDLSKTMIQSMDDAILKMFDSLTYQNSMEKNGNIHYYNGWKTNRACRVGQKVIFAAWGLYDSRWGGSWSVYKATDTLLELEKVFNYLDSGRTDGTNCNEVIWDHFQHHAKTYAGEWISCKFFEVSLKKKCSVHVRFTCGELLKRFNLFGANKKGWLPPAYGKKQYKDMDAEEKAVVNAFEGEKSYEDTVRDGEFLLGGGMLALEIGNKEGVR